MFHLPLTGKFPEGAVYTDYNSFSLLNLLQSASNVHVAKTNGLFSFFSL